MSQAYDQLNVVVNLKLLRFSKKIFGKFIEDRFLNVDSAGAQTNLTGILK